MFDLGKENKIYHQIHSSKEHLKISIKMQSVVGKCYKLHKIYPRKV